MSQSSSESSTVEEGDPPSLDAIDAGSEVPQGPLLPPAGPGKPAAPDASIRALPAVPTLEPLATTHAGATGSASGPRDAQFSKPLRVSSHSPWATALHTSAQQFKQRNAK